MQRTSLAALRIIVAATAVVTLATGCISGLRTQGDTPNVSVQFENRTGDNVRVYLVDEYNREWFLGRVAAFQQTPVRIPQSAIHSDKPIQLVAIPITDRPESPSVPKAPGAGMRSMPVMMGTLVTSRWALSNFSIEGVPLVRDVTALIGAGKP
jgi:hypothetical protein